MFCVNTYCCPPFYFDAADEKEALKLAARRLKEQGTKRLWPKHFWKVEAIDPNLPAYILAKLPPKEEQAEASGALLSTIRQMAGPMYAWVLEQAKSVEITPISMMPEAAEQIAKWVEEYCPEARQCFRNSFYCMDDVPGVRLVHGFVTSDKNGVLIEHAWNELKGHHFDVTSEVYRLGLQGHLQVISLNRVEANRLMVECCQHCHFVLPYFERLSGKLIPAGETRCSI